MSWKAGTSQSLPSSTTLPLPYNRTHPKSLPWDEAGSGRQFMQGEEWAWNKSQPPTDLSLLENGEWCFMSPVLTMFLVVCYCITMVLGLVGNISLISIIARRREKANVTSILICNLSFSDILVCLFCLPFTVIYTLMDHWVFGSMLCRLVPFIQCASVTVSILSLVLIALERHQLIINPSGWKPSIPQAYMAVILIWTLACLTSLPFLAFQLLTNEPYANVPHPKAQPQPQAAGPPRPFPLPQLQSYDNTSLLQPQLHTHSNASGFSNSFHTIFPYAPASAHLEACLEHWPSRQQRLAYTTCLLLFQYCGPLVLVLICYIRVFLHLRRRKDMLDRTRAVENQRMAHSRRINIMLVALITAFALCWLPLTIFNVVSDWNQEALPICHHNLLFSLCHLLAMSSTCINPVIYGFLNSNFRQEVREGLLHCRCQPAEDDYDHFPLSTVHMEVSRNSTPLS
ncbi:neuropeptide Y receptor type 4-2-like [Lampris incognitus]|uniref:neuropeptide Y receptor type 4-2-like n=1 Tax=Lampris incognitus TaxID=2546036 RepID=UPI0024B513C3|nr:neuropeptide Y receptor type 4-2-like [Lampris incognitus]